MPSYFLSQERPDRTIAEVWEDERAHLMPLPRPFDGFVDYAKRASPTCTVHVERNH